MSSDLLGIGPGASIPVILFSAFLLGVLHGITPDEHTWPITFSYAIGSYSTRRGLLSGVSFSLAFTAQRALASFLAYAALARWLQNEHIDLVIYILVGLAMALAGAYILRLGRVFHIHPLSLNRHLFASHSDTDEQRAHALREYRPVSLRMAAVHGFIAGWGFGTFALILYTVLVPAMPNLALSWIPGALFGLGTLTVQAFAGALFGAWMRRRQLAEEMIALVARRVAGLTLWWGGIFFMLAGLLGTLFPAVASWSIVTPINIPNLHHLTIGTLLVLLTVGGIGGVALATTLQQARHGPRVERRSSEGL